jgi:cell division protein FtsW (lipid II flippase)
MLALSRRNTELGLVVLGTLITGSLYVLASLGTTASLPANIGPWLGIVLGLLLLAHLLTRRLAPAADSILLPLAGLLNGIGYVFIARLNPGLAGLQSVWMAVGIAAYIGTLVVVRQTKVLEQYRYTFMLIGLGLLMLPLIPGLGVEINGARIWVRLGPIGLQPGEFAKIILAVFFAAYLVEKRELLGLVTRRIGPIGLPDLKHFGPVLLAWAVSLLVMTAQRDLGSSLLFFSLFVVMLWVATERIAYLGVSTLLFGAGAYIAYLQFAHVQTRVETWLDPWETPFGGGMQLVQATFALAWGGITGTGPGLGSPRNIPVVETDFIFAAIGEELGLLGATAVVSAFLLIVGTGLRIAVRAENPFDKLLATGLTAAIGL